MRNPELIIGIVAPIGVNLESVEKSIHKELSEKFYTGHNIKITKYFPDMHPNYQNDGVDFLYSYKIKIYFANFVRSFIGPEVFSKLVISRIRTIRKEKNEESDGEMDKQDVPLLNNYYLINQLKNPEEVECLRKVYGPQFILIGAYASKGKRKEYLIKKQNERNIMQDDNPLINFNAENLINQDDHETDAKYGQRVRDTFHKADFFVNAENEDDIHFQIKRFFDLFFGKNTESPTKEEYGQYLAKSVSLRSADVSRQVGAAILDDDGNIMSVGCNDVPKFGGGIYWPDDQNDNRDIKRSSDINYDFKLRTLCNLIDAFKEQEILSENIKDKNTEDILDDLINSENDSVRESKLMDSLEFSRVVHAEMAAITIAARNGVKLKDSILYCTTFPCHLCAKLIISSGISKVIYLEPFPKSYATHLHSDSIAKDEVDANKVIFSPFLGVSPRIYKTLFERGRRKDKAGTIQEWCEGKPTPLIDRTVPTYYVAENAMVADLSDKLEALHGSDLPTVPPNSPPDPAQL